MIITTHPFHIGSISVPEQNIFLETWADFCEVTNITDLICSFHYKIGYI